MPEAAKAPASSQRADLWLPHLRLFKTRSLAAAACRKGQVHLGGAAIKPSRELRHGDLLEVQQGPLKRRLKVLGFAPQRLPAKAVPAHCEDLTPAEAIEKARQIREQERLHNPPSQNALLQRPNKQQRRALRDWWAQQPPE
jgi:ribosome-associated heat shock protein Hsp15